MASNNQQQPLHVLFFHSAVDRANDSFRDRADTPPIVVSTVPFPNVVGLPPGVESVVSMLADTLLRNKPLEHTLDGPDAGAAAQRRGRSQLMDRRKDELEWDYYDLVNEADRRSFGEVFNSFAELEPDYVAHYRATLGLRVWLIGPAVRRSRRPLVELWVKMRGPRRTEEG